MGGLWVDYNLMSTIPGLYVIGEANFSDHGANRLGASALMQGLADGYFILPYTIGAYLASTAFDKVSAESPECKQAEGEVRERMQRLMAVQGKTPAAALHRKLGKVMWEYCGMGRNEAGLQKVLAEIPAIRDEFWRTVCVPGVGEDFNQSLERAARVADYMEFAELLCLDALQRRESCGGHFREEWQTPDGEAQRDDEHFAHVSVWEYAGAEANPALHQEPLTFEYVKPTQRSYK
jgi:succinate dehydrogenase / fumarate reductase flavoprotein subunit